MSYYLPIMINSRRLHVCHLKHREDASNVPWGFIVNTETPELLSLLPNEICLIAEDGQHITIGGGWTFAVQQHDRNYIVELVKSESHQNKCGNLAVGNVVVTGRVGDDNVLALSVDKTDLDYSEPINVKLVYKHEVNGVQKSFSETLVFYLKSPNDNVSSVALDFGSEASQVRFADMAQNISILDEFHRKIYGDSSTTAPKSFWQGNLKDTLFKSIFWLNFSPKMPTCYADTPENVNAGPLFSPLIPDDYNVGSMSILPNLKLVELSQGGGFITYDVSDILLQEGSDISYQQPNIADLTMRNSCLRIILSNFLHVILSRVNKVRQSTYVRLVLMAPNVYYQDKVFDMMKWIYADFEIMKKNYPKCKGIEVQIVSESDAAFIGARKGQRIEDIPGGLFLNIDSGKGTTDFSILQQCNNLNKFISVYRDGLPAAGNVLTYAYYEALYDYMKEHSIDIQTFFAREIPSNIIQFFACLEDLKKHDSVVGFDDERNLMSVPSADIVNLTNLNRYLSNNKDKKLPFIKKYLQAKVDDLVECLEESIGHYMEMHECIFSKVILSGRAFMCPLYREAVEDMLLRRGWIETSANLVWVGGNQAKTCCLSGALAMESECDVNDNSGLIGSPLLTDCTPGFFKKILARCHDMLKMKYSYSQRVKVDKTFFAEGSDGVRTRNLKFRLGGRAITLSSDEVTAKKIFFLGDKFAVQEDDRELRYIPSNDLHFTNDKFEALVKQSLFPHYKGSAGRPNKNYFKDDLKFESSAPLAGSAGKPNPGPIAVGQSGTNKSIDNIPDIDNE